MLFLSLYFYSLGADAKRSLALNLKKIIKAFVIMYITLHNSSYSQECYLSNACYLFVTNISNQPVAAQDAIKLSCNK